MVNAAFTLSYYTHTHTHTQRDRERERESEHLTIHFHHGVLVNWCTFLDFIQSTAPVLCYLSTNTLHQQNNPVLPTGASISPHQSYAVRLDAVGPEHLLHNGPILCQQLKQLDFGKGSREVVHMQQLAVRVE